MTFAIPFKIQSDIYLCNFSLGSQCLRTVGEITVASVSEEVAELIQPSKIILAKYIWHLGVKKGANMIVTEFTAGSNSNSDSVSSQRCFTVIAARWSNVYSFSVIQPWIKPGYQLTGFNTWMPKSAILEVTLPIYLQNTSSAIRNIAREGDPLEKEVSEQKWGAFLSSCWPLFIFSSYVSVGNFSHFFQALRYGSGAECWWGSAQCNFRQCSLSFLSESL